MTPLPVEPSWAYEGTFWLGVLVGYVILAPLTLWIVWKLGKRYGHIIEVTRSSWSQQSAEGDQ